MNDVRWKQRLSNLTRAVSSLERGLLVAQPNELEQQGIVKAFELAYELSWKTLQDYLSAQGLERAVGPKPVIREALNNGLLDDGDVWATMHEARNRAAHVYDEQQAAELLVLIRDGLAQRLRAVCDRLGALADD